MVKQCKLLFCCSCSSRADRNPKESGKKKDGGIVLYVNDKWCNTGHIYVKEQLCTRDIELLAMSISTMLWHSFRPTIPKPFSSSPGILTIFPCPPLFPTSTSNNKTLDLLYGVLLSLAPAPLLTSPHTYSKSKKGVRWTSFQYFK